MKSKLKKSRTIIESKISISSIKTDLRKYSSPERKKTNEWFFKTGKGEYGEGDKFIGVRVPNIRIVARKYSFISLENIEKLLQSAIHEERLLAILILVENAKLAQKNKDKKSLKEISDFYLSHTDRINNWDLVDLSAHYILGQSILSGVQKKSILNKLVKSKVLWERRIAIITTWIFIRSGEYTTTLELAKMLLKDKEDLMHKAVGWMLRELWKKDAKIVEVFLIENYDQLPRTTLRYAIEKMDEVKRKKFLKGEIK